MPAWSIGGWSSAIPFVQTNEVRVVGGARIQSNGNITVVSGATIGWSSSATDPTVAADTTASRGAAGVVNTAVLSLGTTPATAGILRMPNNTAFNFRNQGNTANVQALTIDANNALILGDTNVNVLPSSVGTQSVGTTTTRWLGFAGGTGGLDTTGTITMTAGQQITTTGATGRWTINTITTTAGAIQHDVTSPFVHTSGTASLTGINASFTPASGSGSWALAHLNPTINGTSSGTAYGFLLASKTNTLTGGTIKLLSLGTTTTDGFTGYTEVLGLTAAGALAMTGSISASTSITSTGATSGIGYGTGAGGTVTQLTSKSTGVTLNAATGAITLSNAALGAQAVVSFTLTNSAIGANDLLVLNHKSVGTVGAYTFSAQPAAGSAVINVTNVTAGSLSEAIVVSYALIKGVVA